MLPFSLLLVTKVMFHAVFTVTAPSHTDSDSAALTEKETAEGCAVFRVRIREISVVFTNSAVMTNLFFSPSSIMMKGTSNECKPEAPEYHNEPHYGSLYGW